MVLFIPAVVETSLEKHIIEPGRKNIFTSWKNFYLVMESPFGFSSGPQWKSGIVSHYSASSQQYSVAVSKTEGRICLRASGEGAGECVSVCVCLKDRGWTGCVSSFQI